MDAHATCPISRTSTSFYSPASYLAADSWPAEQSALLGPERQRERTCQTAPPDRATHRGRSSPWGRPARHPQARLRMARMGSCWRFVFHHSYRGLMIAELSLLLALSTTYMTLRPSHLVPSTAPLVTHHGQSHPTLTLPPLKEGHLRDRSGRLSTSSPSPYLSPGFRSELRTLGDTRKTSKFAGCVWGTEEREYR